MLSKTGMNNRTSRPEGIHKNIVLKNFRKFRGKCLCKGSFLIKFWAHRLELYLKKDSDTGVYLRIFRNFSEQLFHGTSTGCCSRINSDARNQY